MLVGSGLYVDNVYIRSGLEITHFLNYGCCVGREGATGHPTLQLYLLCSALHCTTLHYIVLYCTVLHYIVLHCMALNCTSLHCTTLHCTVMRCTALHFNSLHCTALHYTALHCTALHCTEMHCIGQLGGVLHYTK